MTAYPAADRRRLATILIEAGVITEGQVEDAVRHQQENGCRIGESLVDLGMVSEEDIGWALSRQLSVAFVDLHLDALDESLIREFAQPLLRRLQALPLVRTDKEITFALADPTDGETIAELERESRARVRIGVATATKIAATLDAIFGAQRSPRTIVGDRLQLVESDRELARERSATGFLQFHVENALQWPATELHFVPAENRLDVYYRIGPDLHLVATEPLAVVESLSDRLEALGGPTMSDSAGHARGWVESQVGERSVGIEISGVRSPNGPTVTLRLHPRYDGTPTLEELGFSPAQLGALEVLVREPAGVLVVTGPPRSGITTTLSAFYARFASANRRSLVVETGAAGRYPGATRVRAAKRSLAAGWPEIVSAQCADCVVLDGVVPGEAIRQVLRAEFSGRLVLLGTDWTDTHDLLSFLSSQPHARNALASRLLAVVQQRLVRYGKSGPVPDHQGLPPWQCGIFEVLVLNEEARRALREDQGVSAVTAQTRREGFMTLEQECQRRMREESLSRSELARALR